jgi:hypothetical protein
MTGVRQSYWATQSAVTDPGPAGTAIDELAADLAALRQASSQLVFHYRAGGDYAHNGVPAERISEIDTRYADTMFGLVLERGEPALTRDRRPADRLVGCCRDATVFFLALARHKGIPARARVGFAAYLAKGWLIDHEIAEVWDERDSRWRLVDPEMDTAWTPEVNGRRVDWLDLTADQFVTGPRAGDGLTSRTTPSTTWPRSTRSRRCCGMPGGCSSAGTGLRRCRTPTQRCSTRSARSPPIRIANRA